MGSLLEVKTTVPRGMLSRRGYLLAYLAFDMTFLY
jgi:hypothetical protein